MIVRLGIGVERREALLALPTHLPVPFQGLEFPGDFLDSSVARHKINSFAPDRLKLSVRDLVPPERAQLAPTQDLAQRLEFLKLFGERCRRAAEICAFEVSVAFDLMQASESVAYYRSLMLILQACLGILAKYRLRLHFPVRLPQNPGDPELEWYVAFRRDCLFPATSFVLDLHPLELLPSEFFPLEPENSRLDPEKLRPLQFYCEYWRMVFDAGEWRYLDFEVPRHLLELGRLLPGSMWVVIAPSQFTGESLELEGLASVSEPLLGISKKVADKSN